MSLTVTNTAAVQTTLPTKEKPAVTPAAETKPETKSNLGSDTVTTSNGKSGLAEGIKFHASRGLLIGGAAGAITFGGGTWVVSKVIGAIGMQPKTLFGPLGGKSVAVMAGAGIVAGALAGAASGALDGAVTGTIVDQSKKMAAAKGESTAEAKAHAKKMGFGVGAAIGAATSIKSAVQLSSGIGNPTVKAAVTVGLIAFGAVSAGSMGSYFAGRVYDKTEN